MSYFSPPTVVVEDETNLEAVHFTLKWSIHHFEGLKNKDTFLYSPGITMAELGMEKGYRGRWRISVKPCNSVTLENTGKKDFVSVYLSLTDEDVNSIKFTGERELSCVYKPRVTSGKLMDVPIFTPMAFTNVRTFSSANRKGLWGFTKVVSHKKLFGTDVKAGCLKDTCLNIAIDVYIYMKPKSTRIAEAVSPSMYQRQQEFLGRQLKQQEAGGDFLLVSSNNKEFHVDRCLLMAHSPVFAAMLNHDSKEKQTSRCNMEDVDGECVEILLDYVYGCETGKIQGNNAEKGLVMADKYQMMDLRAECERTLANNMTAENAVQVFLLARQRNLDTLKDVAKKFIRKNMDLDAILDESFDI